METRPLLRADLITGVVLVVFGLAVLAASYGMPRLEERNINPWTAPGIVPGILAIVVTILGAALALRSLAAGALHVRSSLSAEETVEARAATVRLLLCGALCLIYAVGLVGRLPFWLATALFVFAFIVVFEWSSADSNAARLTRIGFAAAIAAAAAIVIPYVFEYLFLVRLP